MSAIKKIAYIDMDGVLANFDKAVGFKNHYNSDPPEMFVPGFYKNLELIPGAKEAVETLLAFKNLDIYIATKPTTKYLGCATEKFEWIEKYFPALLKKMFITCDKGHLNGDYLIDDDYEQWGKKFKGKFLEMDPNNSEECWKNIVEYLRKYE